MQLQLTMMLIIDDKFKDYKNLYKYENFCNL